MKDTKRQVLPSGLWVVATPIGNLADLTPRARVALEEADCILCEDTRRTSVLLSALGMHSLGARLQRLDAHTPEAKIQNWVVQMQEGKRFALVTDAGTPAISDPGALLVARSRAAHIQITPFPGASAVLALLSVCGFYETAFTFRGFFPKKREEKEKEFQLVCSSQVSDIFVWFESPLRVVDTLGVLENGYPDVSVVVAKELTKIHERTFFGSASQVSYAVQEEVLKEGALGEWCFAVRWIRPKKSKEDLKLLEDESSVWSQALSCLLNLGISTVDAAKEVSQEFGISKRQVYNLALRKKNLKGG